MVRGSITSGTNVSFKQLCSRVAAITGPWNCVAYRDIRLLQAHSCSRRFSVLVGVVLCKLSHVIPLRESLSGQYVYLVRG